MSRRSLLQFTSRLTIVSMLWCAISGSPAAQGRSTESSGPDLGRARVAPRETTLAFEENSGQYDDAVAFVAYGGGLTAALGADGVRFVLPTPTGAASELRMRVLGGHAVPVGSDRLSGKANYLRGSDSSAWVTNQALYRRVTYADVYPGIDVIYHGDNSGRLQYDFIVSPGANHNLIRLAFDEATSLTVDGDGNLVVAGRESRLVQTAPTLYQLTDDGRRRPVSGAFAIDPTGHVGFNVGDYDASRPLVIDPVSLSYSTFLGTELREEARDVATDAVGNSYVVGTRIRPSLDSLSPDTRDAFVAKYDPTGSLVYLTYIGGRVGTPSNAPFLHAAGNDDGDGIAVGPISTSDATVVAYVTGWTTSTDFPIAGPAHQRSLTHDPINNPFGARQNAFLAKLNAQGDGLLYSSYLGRNNFGRRGISYRGQSFAASGTYEEGYQYGRDIAVDANAVAYVVGSTDGIQRIAQTFFDDSFDVPRPPNDPFHIKDAFLHRIDLNPASPVYGRPKFNWNLFANDAPGQFGNDYAATAADIATGVALSPDGDVFVTGYTSSSDLYTSPGAFQSNGTANLASLSQNDAFVVQFDGPDADGGDDDGVGGFEYATYLGGTGDDRAYGIAVNSSEQAFVTGGTTRDSFPTTGGALQRSSTSSPFGAGFVSKLTESGSALAYSTFLGGDATVGHGIAVDDLSRAYVVGYTTNQGSVQDGPPPYDAPPLVCEVLCFGSSQGPFPLTEDATDAFSSTHSPRAFLTVVNADGAGLLFSTFHGARTSGQGVAVRVVRDGTTIVDREAVVVGSIESPSMLVVNAEQPTYAGHLDGFVAKWIGFASTTP